jgi:small subunit ribosomal protein S36
VRSEYGPRAVPGPLRRLRSDPDRWLVLATTLAFAGLLVVFSVLTPVWRSPDETNHFDLVLDVADGRGYAAWDADVFSQGVLEASAPVRTAPPRVPIAPGARPPALPSVDESSTMSATPNHMTQHPPVYYGLAGAELAVAQALGLAPASLSGQLAVARVLSALLLVPVPALAWLTATVLRASRRARRLALLVPLAIPGLVQVGSGLTNDVLTVLLFSALAVVLAVYVAGRRSPWVAAAAGALGAVALLTKAFGAGAVVWALLVIIATWRAGEGRRVLRDGLLAGGLASLLGGWWYVRNLVQEGRLLPSLEEARFSSQSVLAGSDKSFDQWFDRFTPVAGRGFFGLFGYADVAVSDRVYRVLLALVLVGAVAGVVALWRSRAQIVLLVAPLPILLVLQATQSYRLYETSGVVALGHGRYLLPAIVPCAVLVATGVDHLARRGGRAITVVALAVVVAAQLHAASRLLEFFWSSEGGTAAFRVATDWSPLPRPVVLASVGLTALLLAVVLALLVRGPVPPDPVGAAPTRPPRPTR